MTKAKTETRR